jgi:hypothetical protein
MIAIPASQIQISHLSRSASIRHGRARPNARVRSQLVHRSSSLKANTNPHSKPLMRANSADQSAQSGRLSSCASSAALKSP